MSRKPQVFIIGSDKGGVGKSTCARVLSDYLQARGANAKLFDTELGAGDLKRFAPAATMVDIAKTSGQMRVFDTLYYSCGIEAFVGELPQFGWPTCCCAF